MTAPKIYAARGEWVRCESGHKICRVAHDLRYGDVEDPAHDWTDWQQPAPAYAERPENIKCIVCGAPYFRGNAEFHFADGWRAAE
jgi:hypothetical protein